MGKPALIVVPDTSVPVTSETAWWQRFLAWAGLREQKPAVYVHENGMVRVHPKNVERVAQIFREEGYPVVSGHYKKPTLETPREPWAASPKPSQSLGPKVTRPNLRPIQGGKQ